MIIRHITIRDFGSVPFYDTALTRSLNIIDTRYAPEISAAVAFLLALRDCKPRNQFLKKVTFVGRQK